MTVCYEGRGVSQTNEKRGIACQYAKPDYQGKALNAKVIQLRPLFFKSFVFICHSGADSKLQKPPFTQDISLPSLQVLLGMRAVVSEDASLQDAENLGPDSAAQLGVVMKRALKNTSPANRRSPVFRDIKGNTAHL